MVPDGGIYKKLSNENNRERLWTSGHKEARQTAVTQVSTCSKMN